MTMLDPVARFNELMQSFISTIDPKWPQKALTALAREIRADAANAVRDHYMTCASDDPSEEYMRGLLAAEKAIMALSGTAQQMREALILVDSVGRNVLGRKFNHCGTMNATQLGERDCVLNMLAKVSAALAAYDALSKHEGGR